MSQNTKVFVGSLPNGTKPEDLRHLFERFGVVVECDVMNRCGFVHMQNPMMANEAIAELNGIEIRGQKIVVEAGRPKDHKAGGRGGDGGGRRGGYNSDSMGRSRSPRGSSRMDGFHGNSGPGNRGSMSHRSNFGGGEKFPRNNSGPIRNSNYKQDRNGPYQRGGGGSGNSRFRDGNNFDGSSRESRFNGNSRSNFNNGPGAGYGGNQSGNWDRSNSGRSSFVKGYNSNDGGFSGHRESVGQDRRGFALPSGGHQDRHGFSGTNPGGFSGNERGSGYGDRSVDRNMNGNSSGGRGGRGNFNGGSGSSSSRSGPPGQQGGMGFRRSQNVNNYMNEFPPLGGGARGMNRNAPRQNMMSNRRY